MPELSLSLADVGDNGGGQRRHHGIHGRWAEYNGPIVKAHRRGSVHHRWAQLEVGMRQPTPSFGARLLELAYLKLRAILGPKDTPVKDSKQLSISSIASFYFLLTPLPLATS